MKNCPCPTCQLENQLEEILEILKGPDFPVEAINKIVATYRKYGRLKE